MKATTSRRALLETLGKARAAAASNHGLPVLTSVLIRAGSGQLSLTGSDLEVFLTSSCKAAVSRQGSVCAPPRELEAFLKAVTADRVTVSAAGKRSLRIDAGAASTTLQGYEAQDYPRVPGVSGKAVAISSLAKVLKEVSYAMANEEARPALTGVCFTQDNGHVELAASDGFRLAITRAKARGALDEQLIVPAVAISLLQRLMPGTVSLHRGKDYMAFVGDDLVLTTKPVESTYPNYRHLVTRGGSKLQFDRDELAKAIKLVATIKDPKNTVRLQSRAGKLTVSAKYTEVGETSTKVPARGKVKMAFDINFLKELLAKLDRQVTLRIKTPQAPVRAKANGTTHMLMPKQVEW